MSIVLDRVLSIGTGLHARTVSTLVMHVFPDPIGILHDSPKPELPSPKAYEPPPPPSTRDLGPPPPGYGRYADFDRGFPSGPIANASVNAPGLARRNLDDVLCFKVKYTLFMMVTFLS